MKYLDYDKFSDFYSREFQHEIESGQTAVGIDRQHDSGYCDIVRFFGDGSINPDRVAIEYLPGCFELSDPKIAAFAQKVAKMLSDQGRLYDGPPVTKLVGCDFNTDRPRICIQQASYRDLAGSCFALDLSDKLFHDEGGTLRNYYNRICQSHDIAENPLALSLGVCGVIVIAETDKTSLMVVRRASRLASLEGTIGPAAAGSVDFVEGYQSLGELIDASLGAEIAEELTLTKDDYEITPLAYAREIFRGENPQLFCMIRTSLNRREIDDRLKSIDPTHSELTEHLYIELDSNNRLSGKAIGGLNHEAAMNCFLVEEYLGVD